MVNGDTVVSAAFGSADLFAQNPFPLASQSGSHSRNSDALSRFCPAKTFVVPFSHLETEGGLTLQYLAKSACDLPKSSRRFLISVCKCIHLLIIALQLFLLGNSFFSIIDLFVSYG